MLRSFLAHFYERSARVEPTAAWAFMGQYSAFSGIVTEISVGSSDQRLLVSLNFAADHVSLYDPLTCPAYVGLCYSSTDSPSFSDGTDIITLENGRSLGSVPIESNVDARSSSRFSEVAGWIGASPRALLFQFKALSIRELSDELVEISEVSPDSSQRRTEARIGIFSSRGSWMAHCRTQLQGQLLPGVGLMQYDPGEQDFVIPSFLGDEVVGFVGQGFFHNTRLAIPCNSVVAIEFVFPVQRLHLRLESLNLFFPNSHPPALRDFCITRIRVDSSLASRVVVGRILTRSAGEVVLNFKHRWMGLSTETLISEPFSSPRARVPVFEVPRPPERRIRLTIAPIVSPERYPEGVILVSCMEREIGLSDIRGVGYSFIRIEPFDPHYRHEIFFVRIHGFSAVEPPITHADDFLEFRFSHGDARSELIMAYGPAHVAILQVAAIPPMMLPEAEVHTGDDLTVECPICLDAIEEGQIKQRIDPCMHYFHRSCLLGWIEKPEKLTCPMCRSEIPRANV